MDNIRINQSAMPPAFAPAAAEPAPRSVSPRRSKITPIARFMAWAIVIGLGVFAYGRMTRFGTRVVEAQPVDARIEIANPPAWLDRRIVSSLLDEAYQFAGHDVETYNRVRNLLDSAVLREFANLYTGTSVENGQTVSRQTIGYNAWISKVNQVRRATATGQEMQTIQIVAEWRQPAAWVRVYKNGEPFLYLMDSEGTRLPGEYRAADRGKSPLMVIGGIDLPKNGTAPFIPAPGEKWFANSTAMGEDLAAGLQMVLLLEKQKFAAQIAAVDVTNFNGRRDDRGPWILLETVFPTATGTPRVVQWGRPPGQEKYYEVQAPAKLKTLKDLYARFNRIDANRDYVDIRSDVIRLPKLAIQAESAVQPRG
jgi:hypothetical protein